MNFVRRIALTYVTKMNGRVVKRRTLVILMRQTIFYIFSCSKANYINLILKTQINFYFSCDVCHYSRVNTRIARFPSAPEWFLESKKFLFAEDLALTTQTVKFTDAEITLNRDMATMDE